MPYCKLDEGILLSTVWREPDHVLRVWLAMLALKGRNGEVRASVPGLADICRVTRAECDDALARLLSPDPDSRSREYDGRRIETIDGGWFVLNHEKYRKLDDEEDQREKAAARQRRHRARNGVSRLVTPESRGVTKSNDIAEAEAEASSSLDVFGESAHRTAYLSIRECASNAQAFDAMLRTLQCPISGGAAYDWTTIGQALLEIHATGGKATPNAIRAFCRKLREPEKHSAAPSTRQERGRAALARTLTRHRYRDGQPADDHEVSRPVPRGLPDC